MALVRPPVLPVWAESGAKTQPSDAEIDIGWPLSSIPPSRQRFNWFFNYVMNGVRYLTRRGLSDFSIGDTYAIGDRVIGSDNLSYTSLTGANLGNDPTLLANQGVTWDRWGYTKAQLLALLRTELYSPTTCPPTGPAVVPAAATPWLYWTSTIGEYWEWQGSAWKVVAGRYRTSTFIASNSLPAGVATAVVQVVAPRNGRATVRGVLSALSAAGGVTLISAQIRRIRGGVTTLLSDSGSIQITTATSQDILIRPTTDQDILAGDTFVLIGTPTQAIGPHPLNATSVYLEYV